MALQAIYYDGFWKRDHDFLIVFHGDVLSGMHGFRANEVWLQAGNEVIVIFPLGALQAIFHDGFWRRYYDFLIVFHGNFLYAMHGFQDNEVLLQAGYDVIVISPLGGASDNVSWRIMTERPWLPDNVL